MSVPPEPLQQNQLERIAASRRRQADGQERFLKEVGGLVGETQQLRLEAEQLSTKLGAKATALRELVRRSTDEGAPNLLVFANAHLRLAGALQQAVRRTAVMDRVVKKAEQDREEARQHEGREAQYLAAQQQAKALEQALGVSNGDAFDELYGDVVNEELTDAQ